MQYRITLFFLFVITSPAFTQQLPLFSQYRENYGLLNPAMVHSDFVALSYRPQNTAGISYRYQWTGVSDSPKTYTARYEHVFDRQNFLVGGSLIKDETGPTGMTGGYGRYAYLVRFSRKTFLSLGGSVGFINYTYQPEKGLLRDQSDAIGLAPESVYYLDASFGGYFQTEFYNNNKLYSGLSILQLAKIHFSEENGYQPQRVPHFYWHGGMFHYISDGFGDWMGDLFLEPSLWVKYALNAPLQVDANVRFQMAGVFFVGVGYSFATSTYDNFDNFRGNNFIFEGGLTFGEDVGFDYAQLKIGYSFARSISVYGPRLGYTHEVNVTYAWED